MRMAQHYQPTPFQDHEERSRTFDRIGELEEEVRQLRDLLRGPKIRFPVSWKLTLQQERMLRTIYNSPDGYRTYDQIVAVVYPGGETTTGTTASDRDIHVILWHLRRNPEIQITTIRGTGLYLSPDAKARIDLAIENERKSR